MSEPDRIFEEFYVKELEDFLVSKGYEVFREVVPDECATWDKPWRVDMIIKLQDYL